MTSGYSGTRLAAKLGIKSGHRVLLRGAPREWLIDDLPERVRISRRHGGSPANVVIAFFRDAASLNEGIVALASTITTDGALWIAWPRKAAGHVSNITDNVIRDTVLPLGLVDVKVAALDEDWSALKMVWRKKLRAIQR
ncbi:MAG TPA: DUF3052 family protein [Acidimicrobiales bacterium]